MSLAEWPQSTDRAFSRRVLTRSRPDLAARNNVMTFYSYVRGSSEQWSPFIICRERSSL